ncbi:AmmeMemoRadiSam system protein A [Arcobacter sp. YIC-464]|uniref:AmmeMemoRadiSam system protein A n=1 Tax=Arcobacter sp. YIC-464 TaxID=3376631 RepID=UPI003C17DEE1
MDNQLLLKIAKDTIASRFDKSKAVDKQSLLEDYPFLSEKRATFVTINLDNKLRGCIGTLEAKHSLLDDLVANANSAAYYDPRFYPLSLDELDKVDIEISILSEAKPLNYKDIEDLKNKIIPFKHGVILEKGIKKATFLPQVWEQLPIFENFFEHLCNKADLKQDCLLEYPDIYIYEVQKIK